jgi:transcriptional regulator with GAF, ATPase, and Fis domain
VSKTKPPEQQSFRADELQGFVRNGIDWIELGHFADPTRLNDERPDSAVQSRIAELAGALVGGADIEDVLIMVTFASVALVPGADFAKISAIDNGRLCSIAATSQLTAVLDGAQQAGGQGPCLDAIIAHKTIRCGDLRTDVRWPRFAPAATNAGVHSALSYPLDVPGAAGATLSLFGSEPEAFAAQSDAIGAMLASHAAIALLNEEQERQFKAALATRDVIGQAKGMIMERFDVDASRAFAMLTAISQETNTPVRDLAARLVDGAKQPQ